MQNSDIFFELLAMLEDRFIEIDSDITTALRESDAEYVALKKQLTDLERQFPFIESVLDGEGDVSLTAEEHAGLVEYNRKANDADNRERLNLYFAGHRDCFAYLKRIGLL